MKGEIYVEKTLKVVGLAVIECKSSVEKRVLVISEENDIDQMVEEDELLMIVPVPPGGFIIKDCISDELYVEFMDYKFPGEIETPSLDASYE